MALALQLEDAVRDQYGHEGRFVMGGTGDLVAYQKARARALELSRLLRERAIDRETVARLDDIDAAIEQFGSLGLEVMITELDVNLLPPLEPGTAVSVAATVRPTSKDRNLMNSFLLVTLRASGNHCVPCKRR